MYKRISRIGDIDTIRDTKYKHWTRPIVTKRLERIGMQLPEPFRPNLPLSGAVFKGKGSLSPKQAKDFLSPFDMLSKKNRAGIPQATSPQAITLGNHDLQHIHHGYLYWGGGPLAQRKLERLLTFDKQLAHPLDIYIVSDKKRFNEGPGKALCDKLMALQGKLANITLHLIPETSIFPFQFEEDQKNIERNTSYFISEFAAMVMGNYSEKSDHLRYALQELIGGWYFDWDALKDVYASFVNSTFDQDPKEVDDILIQSSTEVLYRPLSQQAIDAMGSVIDGFYDVYSRISTSDKLEKRKHRFDLSSNSINYAVIPTSDVFVRVIAATVRHVEKVLGKSSPTQSEQDASWYGKVAYLGPYQDESTCFKLLNAQIRKMISDLGAVCLEDYEVYFEEFPNLKKTLIDELCGAGLCELVDMSYNAIKHNNVLIDATKPYLKSAFPMSPQDAYSLGNFTVPNLLETLKSKVSQNQNYSAEYTNYFRIVRASAIETLMNGGIVSETVLRKTMHDQLTSANLQEAPLERSISATIDKLKNNDAFTYSEGPESNFFKLADPKALRSAEEISRIKKASISLHYHFILRQITWQNDIRHCTDPTDFLRYCDKHLVDRSTLYYSQSHIFRIPTDDFEPDGPYHRFSPDYMSTTLNGLALWGYNENPLLYYKNDCSDFIYSWVDRMNELENNDAHPERARYFALFFKGFTAYLKALLTSKFNTPEHKKMVLDSICWLTLSRDTKVRLINHIHSSPPLSDQAFKNDIISEISVLSDGYDPSSLGAYEIEYANSELGWG